MSIHIRARDSAEWLCGRTADWLGSTFTGADLNLSTFTGQCVCEKTVRKTEYMKLVGYIASLMGGSGQNGQTCTPQVSRSSL